MPLSTLPDSRTLAKDLARQVRADILKMKLGVNDHFMTEADMAEKYAVSRGIVRETVSRLRAQGILGSRQGKGLFVKDPDPALLFAQGLPMYGRSESRVLALAELRYTLEVGAVGLIVENATDEQIARLTDLASSHTKVIDRHEKLDRAYHLDNEFHCLLLDMTDNHLLKSMHQVIIEYFDIHVHDRNLPQPTRAELDRAAQAHREIAKAINNRQIKRVRDLLCDHLHVNIVNFRASFDGGGGTELKRAPLKEIAK